MIAVFVVVVRPPCERPLRSSAAAAEEEDVDANADDIERGRQVVVVVVVVQLYATREDAFASMFSRTMLRRED